MTRWGAFAGVALAVLVLLLGLARASQSVVSGDADSLARGEPRWLDSLPDGVDHLEACHPGAGDATAPTRRTPAEATLEPGGAHSTTALLANVAVSHGLFALLLLGGIWLAAVPPAALGVSADPWSGGLPAVGVGLAAGVALTLANTTAAGLAEALGADVPDDLRELLAPETRRGWIVLLGVVLPVIAGFEELLFRGVLVGAFAVGFGVSPWLLAVVSSVAFALGHGAQGGLGIVVTGLLGFALAGLFVVTGSLLTVVVAHYVVNAAEFVVVEAWGWEPFG